MPPSRRTTPRTPPPPTAAAAGNLFTIRRAPATVQAGSRRGRGRAIQARASFSLRKCVFQQGDQQGQESGNVMADVICTYGKNEDLKTKANEKTLANKLRFNEEKKKYGVHVYNAKHAGKLLEACKMVSEQDERDLADVEIDETIFENAKSCDIALIKSVVVENKEMVAFGGATFAWKDKIKELGFKFDVETKLWIMEKDMADLDGIMGEMEDYGFPVTEYDGVDDA